MEPIVDQPLGNVVDGHPGGIIEVGAKIKQQGDAYEYKEALVIRTARRLMEGNVLVPEKCFCKPTV